MEPREVAARSRVAVTRLLICQESRGNLVVPMGVCLKGAQDERVSDPPERERQSKDFASVCGRP